MELKSLLVGLVFTVGVFAIKSGAGIAYLLGRRGSWLRRLAVIFTFAAGYGLVFVLTWLIVSRVSVVLHLDVIMHVFRGGMALHVVFAILLCIWGTLLRIGHRREAVESHGWLMLVVPCPVCFAVFVCSGELLQNLFPETGLAMFWLYCGFIAVSCLTALLLFLLKRASAPERMLGKIMIFAGLYFVLTLLIVPHFADIDRIYRLSLGRDQHATIEGIWSFSLIIAIAFSFGFFKNSRSFSWK